MEIQKRKEQYRIVLPEVLLQTKPPAASNSSTPPTQAYQEALIKLINTASVVAQIYERFRIDENHELAQLFSARCGSGDVPWLEFFYNRDRTYSLAQRLFRSHCRGEPIPHPVAWVIRLQRHDCSGELLAGAIHHKPFEPLEEPNVSVPELPHWTRIGFGLWLDAPSCGERFEPGQDLLVFGVPELKLPKASEIADGRGFLDVNTRIVDPRQIAPLSPHETGSS